MRSGLLVALSLALLLPIATSAQSLGGIEGGADAFSISVSPQYPSPLGQATLSFLSSSIDLANAVVTVSVGGKQIYQGSSRPVSVPLGKTGSVASVVIKIVSNSQTYTQQLSLAPQDVSLIVEPISSSPPLYLGKSLVPLEGDARIVAMANLTSANGKVVDPSTYAYSWTVDGTSIASASGIGKSALLVASPLQYRARTVSVVVTSQDMSLSSGAELTLQPLEPSVRVYENDPLLGIRFDRALGSQFNIAGTESSLFAAPFSLPTTGGAPFIQWFLDGTSAQAGNSITLRPTGSGEGSASLSLTASASQSSTASTNLTLLFGAKASTNLFGL